MTVSSLLLPVFVEVGLTFVLMFMMGVHRRNALRSGAVQPNDIALREQRWPRQATQYANCFLNQFELPVLFYLVVAFILITSTNSLIFVILAWIFVLARLVHAWIHTGVNDVERRSYAMAASALAVVLMWVIFALRILVTGA